MTEFFHFKFGPTSSNITFLQGSHTSWWSSRVKDFMYFSQSITVSPQLLLFYLQSSQSMMEMSKVQILLRLQNEQIPNRKLKSIICNQALELHGWQTLFQSIKVIAATVAYYWIYFSLIRVVMNHHGAFLSNLYKQIHIQCVAKFSGHLI